MTQHYRSLVCITWILLALSVSLLGQNFQGPEEEMKHILTKVKAFSQAYMDGDYQKMADAYTIDGKIFPNNAQIIEGREAIKKRWVLPEGQSILHHEVQPEEITILGDTAYDYGYYHGKTQYANGKTDTWKGKYVIVWKKVDGDWKMYLDIWNRVPLEP